MIDIFIRFMEKIIPIFRTNYFVGLGATYRITKQPYSWLPLLETEWTAGWKMNLKKPERNFPYAQGKPFMERTVLGSFYLGLLDEGTVLFDNDYEFYQAATIDLRGFRDNRFIGKQSFYQYSDLRLDMGKLKNPFTPLKIWSIQRALIMVGSGFPVSVPIVGILPMVAGFGLLS